MKSKHYGLVCLIILCLSFTALLGYGVYLANAVTGSVHVPGPAAIADIKAPDDETLAYMKFLTSRLEDLSRPAKNTAVADLRMFGAGALHSEQKTDTDGKSPSPDTETMPPQEDKMVFSYVLTLCFASSKNSFCVIDGKLYQKNGLLPDGGKILKIENDRVFILKHNRKEWLYPSPNRNISSEKSEETI